MARESAAQEPGGDSHSVRRSAIEMDATRFRALVRDADALRACIVNFHTARTDVEALPEIVVRIGRAVDAELRPTLA